MLIIGGQEPMIEDKAQRQLRAYRTLAEVLTAAQTATGEAELLAEVCRVAVEQAGFRLAWVGYAGAAPECRVKPVASFGYEAGYLDSIDVRWDEGPKGQGPTGTAIRTGHTAVAQHIMGDPAFEPWREEATRRGYGSSAALVLYGNPGPVGALNLYAAEPNAFDAEELELLERVASTVSFAIGAARGRQQMGLLQQGLLRLDRQETAARVAATIAHDVNNCLMVLMPLMGSLNHPDAADARAALDRAIALNRDLVRLARPVKQEPASPLKLDLAITALTPALRRAATPATLTVELSAAPWEARIEPGRLEQVLTNLVLNARDAMPDGGNVQVKTTRRALRHPMGQRHLGVPEGDYVSVEVSDEGIGLSDEVKERVFEPFFTTKGEKGSGLGLASVFGIARQAGGRVVVESPPGRGAVFEVLLPKAF